ncbi:hypothetical protein EZY14_016400 [Kordia sp. TARA_039_SRF]|nr:hypothetical protein EZY14_016400 [Kordia sp. TARA_039_SRF]
MEQLPEKLMNFQHRALKQHAEDVLYKAKRLENHQLSIGYKWVRTGNTYTLKKPTSNELR